MAEPVGNLADSVMFFRECFDSREAGGVWSRAQRENLEMIQLVEDFEALMFQ